MFLFKTATRLPNYFLIRLFYSTVLTLKQNHQDELNDFDFVNIFIHENKIKSQTRYDEDNHHTFVVLVSPDLQVIYRSDRCCVCVCVFSLSSRGLCFSTLACLPAQDPTHVTIETPAPGTTECSVEAFIERLTRETQQQLKQEDKQRSVSFLCCIKI